MICETNAVTLTIQPSRPNIWASSTSLENARSNTTLMTKSVIAAANS
jgi:hypothetical protein